MMDIFLIGTVAASIALIWRSILTYFPKLRKGIQNRFSFMPRQMLFCGFCFTYWTALFIILFINPLKDWQPPLVIAVAPSIKTLIRITVGWFSVATIAVLLRHAVIAIEELTHYQTHTLNNNPGGLH